MKHTIIALAILSLSGCAITHSERAAEEKPVVTTSMLAKEFDTVPSPSTGKPVSVAVYSFTDKTGQRRPQANIASLSTAVTQGSETFLIQALQNVGKGQWFEVVERVGLDNLTKERLIIRQMREAYEGNNAKPLMPMQFAGMIIEGGIIGYDSSTKSGGVGARWLGIGAQTQYSEDIVTVSLRAISVNTGKVLTTVTVQKTILSSADSISALKFFDVGTRAFESEIGLTINEPGTYAVKAAIEGAVVELIKEGQRKGLWDFKKEEKNELVQTQTSRENTTQATPAAPQSNSGEANGRSKESGKTEERSEVVASADPRELAKNANPTLGARADAVVLAEAIPKAAPMPAPQPKTAYFNMLAFVYKDKDEKSQRTWQLPKGTEVITMPPVQGWSAVTTKDGKKGFVREGVLTFNKP